MGVAHATTLEAAPTAIEMVNTGDVTGRQDAAARARGGSNLGTFSGVFTPSILTILGIILFLRTGYVVGNAGLVGTLGIMVVATAVSILTTISLAATATNIDVRGGGDYYLISRTLGLEFGGAIGLVLFAAQSISIAFYAIGFGEVLAGVIGWDSDWAVRGIAFVALAALFSLAWAGADIATRFQFVVMVLLVIALASFYLGAFGEFDGGVLSDSWSAPSGSIGFWAAFAIFFPAVTGFTQGVSMSGDLADPSRSLPRGTFLAVGVSTVVYLTVAVLLAGGAPLDVLVGDDGAVMRDLAVVGVFVSIGVIAATLSSSMASFLGAPRILQSMASDNVFPQLTRFARGHGEANNPRSAVLLSAAIAVLTVMLGSVNLIAPVVSMFFLISYGLINYATFYEARASSPSFRPRFRWFNKWASLAGAALCAGAMFAINPLAGAAAMLVMFGVYEYLRARHLPERWADASSSHHFRRAVESIDALGHEVEHARHWRPQLLVFSAHPERRRRLIRFAKWIEGDSGYTAVFRIVVGEGVQSRIETDRQQQELQAEVDDLGLNVHARAVLAKNGMEALPVIIQSFGLGRLRPNVVLFGLPESDEPAHHLAFVDTVREVARLGVSVVSISTDPAKWAELEQTPPSERSIVVWWEDNDSGRLALLAAYLCTRNRAWRHASIRLLAPSNGALSKADIDTILDHARIDAEVEIVPSRHRSEVVKRASRGSLVLLPMHIRRSAIEDPLEGTVGSLSGRLPLIAAFHARGPISLDTDPSSGFAAEIEQADHVVKEAEERLSKLEHQLASVQDELLVARAEGRETGDLEDRLDRVHRRVLSARARVETASAERDSLLGEPG